MQSKATLIKSVARARASLWDRLQGVNHCMKSRLFPPTRSRWQVELFFGNPVKPREWFLVSLHVIDEAVQCLRDGSITDVVYDPETARLVGVARTE